MTNSLTTQTAAQIDNVAEPQTSTLATGSSRTITVRPAELSRDEIVVLSAHVQLKGGHYRDEAYQRAGLDAPQLKTRITMLADRGFLKVNKAGASSITVEGRNALESLPADRKMRL